MNFNRTWCCVFWQLWNNERPSWSNEQILQIKYFKCCTEYCYVKWCRLLFNGSFELWEKIFLLRILKCHCMMILKACQFCCYQGLKSTFKSYLFLLRQIFDNGAIQCGRNGARLKADIEIMTRHKKDDSKIIGRISWHQSFEICNIKIFAAHNQQSSDTSPSECLETVQYLS